VANRLRHLLRRSAEKPGSWGPGRRHGVGRRASGGAPDTVGSRGCTVL